MFRFVYVGGSLAWLCVWLCLWAVWSGCESPGTTCQRDAECPTNHYCAITDKQQGVCARKAGTDEGLPNPDASPGADRSSLSEPPTPDTPSGTDRPIVPDQSPNSCLPPPYDPSTDPGNGGQSTSLDALDKAFFKSLRLILHISRNCHQQVWGGGYQMHKIPIYVTNAGNQPVGKGKGTKGFLINHPNPPSGAVLIDAKLVFGLKGVYLYNALKDKVPEPGFSFDMEVAGVKSYAFEYGSNDEFVDPTKGRDAIAFFLHEAFHRIQDFEESWTPAPGDQDTSRYPLDAVSLALAMLEGRILVDGYKGADANKALEMFYATQVERFKLDKSGGVLKSHDALQEWLEGTAQYAEVKYMIALGDPFPDSDINSIPSRMSFLENLGEPSFNTTRDDLLFSFTGRFYGTGAAIGVLLDRIGDTTWKDKIRQGQTFHAQLSQRFSGSDQEQALQQAKTRYKYDELLKLGKQFEAFK